MKFKDLKVGDRFIKTGIDRCYAVVYLKIQDRPTSDGDYVYEIPDFDVEIVN